MTWTLHRLGDVLRQNDDSVPVVGDAEYPIAGVYGFGRGLFAREPIRGSQTSYTELNRLHAGSFVISRVKAWEGAVGIVPPELDGYFVSKEFPSFVADPERADVRWLKYFFDSEFGRRALVGCTKGIGARRERVKEEAFLKIALSMPSVEQQHEMVERLDRVHAQAVSAVSARALGDAALEKLWERAAEDRLARCSTRAKLAELISIQGGGTPSKSNPTYWAGSVPWVSPKDMKRWEITDSEDHISDEATRESPAKLVRPGAILVVTRGMILARTVPVARLVVDAAINQDMKALHPNRRVDGEYLLFALRGMNRSLLNLVARSTHDTRKLETDKLLALDVPVPSLAEQGAIVRELKRLRDSVAEATARAAVIRSDIGAMVRSAVDQAFVPAVERGPSSEAMAS
jgi:type I restriction enzyme S subunit